METPTTSYTCKSKNTNTVWLFRYHLDGTIHSFEVLGNAVTDIQIQWLFTVKNFPYNETRIKLWITDLKKNFEIIKGEFELSFDNFYKMYGNKQKPSVAKRAWDKLPKKDKIEAIISIKHYNNYLKRNQGIAKMYPATYLNQRAWESEYKSL